MRVIGIPSAALNQIARGRVGVRGLPRYVGMSLDDGEEAARADALEIGLTAVLERDS
jgi:hypothetical protein